jgi:pimeloyl-ACP methyl ester carboxylesterase
MTPSPERAPDPIDFSAEVADYDRRAIVGTFDGPRHRMTYRVLGRGRPLILVPGLASTYRGYAPTLNRLAQRFTTVLFDYPGEHRDDGARLGRISHDDLVDDLFGLVDRLELARPALFGLSFGSTIVLKALHRRARCFSRAVLQGGFARRPLRPTERVALGLGRWIPGKTSNLPFHELGLSRNNRSTFPSGRPDLWDVYVEQNGLTPIAGLVHRLDLLHGLDLRSLLGVIPTRVLLIHGSEDRIVPASSFDELSAGLRRATCATMPGVGHQPHYTHPEELAGLAGDFLAVGRRNRA